MDRPSGQRPQRVWRDVLAEGTNVTVLAPCASTHRRRRGAAVGGGVLRARTLGELCAHAGFLQTRFQACFSDQTYSPRPSSAQLTSPSARTKRHSPSCPSSTPHETEHVHPRFSGYSLTVQTAEFCLLQRKHPPLLPVISPGCQQTLPGSSGAQTCKRPAS